MAGQDIIPYSAFEHVDLRAGRIIKAETFPQARKPAFKVWVDFGPDIGVLQTSAQITNHYTPEQLVDARVIGCVNLGSKNIAGFESQFLLCGFADANGHIILATYAGDIPPGAKLH